jgi:hypothetical protein
VKALLPATILAIATACTGGRPAASPDSAEQTWGVIDGATEPSPVLRQAIAQARAAGTGKGGQIALDTGSTGDRITRLLETRQDECALLLARGGSEVSDVDLFAYGDDGEILGADESADNTPTLLVCPPHPRRVFVSARIASGHGVVAIAALPVRPPQAVGVAAKLAIAGVPGGPPAKEPWPGLDERIAEQRERIGGRWTDLRRSVVPLEPTAPTRVSTGVQAGDCLDVLVVPAPEVSHLDVAVETFDGRIVGRAAAAGRSRELVVCSATTTPVTLAIRPRSGRGLAAVVLARSQTDPAAFDRALRVDVTPMSSLDEVSTRVAEHLERDGYDQAARVATGHLVLGRRESRSVELAAGCQRIEVLLGSPGRGVGVWLWSQQGRLVAEARGGEQATLLACGPKQQGRVDLEPTTNGGPYAVDVRTEPRPPAVLQQHPLAASRLSQHLRMRGVIRRAEQLRGATEMSLEPSTLKTRSILVPVGRCVEAGVGLGPGSEGVELRLVDADSDTELERVRGTVSAAARACSLDLGRTLNVRAEVRTTSGEAQALFATRMLSPHK